MNPFRFVLIFLAMLLAGCAHDNLVAKSQADALSAQSQARVAEANARVEEAKAVQALAPKIDAGGAAAYLIAKAIGKPAEAVQVQAPPQPASLLGLAWQSVLQVADFGLRAYGIKAQRDVSIRTSDNNRDVSVASYGAFTSMGNSIMQAGTAGYPFVQAPAANVTTTTLSGQGVIGSGTYTGPVTTITNTTRTCSGGTGAAGGSGTTSGSGGQAPGGTC